MNDWWNDPPEEPEPPECHRCSGSLGGFMSILIGWVNFTSNTRADWAVLVCDECGYHSYYPPDPDPSPEDFIEMGRILDSDPIPPESSPFCPHGKPWGYCDACDHESDLAYDAARERRFR